MSVFARVLTPLQLLLKTYLGSLAYTEMTAMLFWISVVACVLVLVLLPPGLTRCWEIYFFKEWNAGASEKTLISLNCYLGIRF